MKKVLFIILIGLSFTSCNFEQKKKNTEKITPVKLKVFAVNYPLFYFAERIGGENVELLYPIPPNVDPAYWTPSSALEEIQNADLILDNGADYAKWMEKVSLPPSKVINTTESFTDQYIKITEGTTHSHGGSGEHVHYGYAFTTWLDFEIANGQAKAVLEAFIKKQPENMEIFKVNYKMLSSDLLTLANEMNTISEDFQGKSVFTSHPVYQYLGRAYKMNLISEHWEPGANPSKDQWHEFTHKFEKNPAKLMLWEGTPTDETKSKLSEIEVESVIFSPCANTPATGDFLTVMNQNIANLKRYIDESK